ncbi:hypothetical protein EJD97_024417 [Solanum chilense]|uniref:CCHC-type domain-containing protein n=1 Tax=Solanum chilense TaxID=4083 RepID=A0A6N2C1J2_SOLCI|nr:hypothetical protein EJD97_024417 [Solanum chilense]
MPPHRSNARNANAKNANAIPPIPNQEVSMLNFEMLFRFWHRVLLHRTIRFVSIAQMNSFMYVVLDLVKIVCRNSMLLENMRIFWLMNYAQQVEGDNLREYANGGQEVFHHPRTPIIRKGECLAQKERCFECGQSGHRLKDYPTRLGQGSSNGKAQSTTLAAPACRLTQHDNSTGIGGGQCQNKLYAL